MKKLLPALFVLCSSILFGQGNQLITHEQSLPCLNKKFTIIVHLVEDITGDTDVQEQDVLDNVAEMNDYWDEICVSFEVCEFRNIPNHNYDTLNRGIEYPQMLIDYHQANRINIFYVNDILSLPIERAGFASLGGISNVNSGGIVMIKTNEAGRLFHQMGRYFGLERTYQFDETTEELVNGDNCETEGDNICDTPADPYTIFEQYSQFMDECTFISTKVDANGEFYRPDVGNIMSPYIPCYCGFTTGQYIRMAEVCAAADGSMW